MNCFSFCSQLNVSLQTMISLWFKVINNHMPNRLSCHAYACVSFIWVVIAVASRGILLYRHKASASCIWCCSVDVLLNHANGHEFASIAGAGNWCARISSYIERGRILSVSVLSSWYMYFVHVFAVNGVYWTEGKLIFRIYFCCRLDMFFKASMMVVGFKVNFSHLLF